MTSGPPAPDLQAVHLAEFDRLREEIDNRTQLSTNLVIAELTAFGAGISFFDKVPDVLVGLALVSSYLWLLWLDHTEQIYKIAAYIGCRLAPRMRAGEEALGWEHFLRVLDAGGVAATEALFGVSAERREVEVQPTRNVGRYIMLLFGVSPPALLLLYLLPFERGPAGMLEETLRFAAVLLALALWAYACRQYRRFRRTITTIDDALRRSTGGPQAAK